MAASETDILSAIKARIGKADGDGCLLWSGMLSDKGSPIVEVQRRQVHVQRYLWNVSHPDEVGMDAAHVCPYTCGKQRCVNVEHLRKVPRKKEFDAAATWTKLESKHGVRKENGCLVANVEYKTVHFRGMSVRLHQAAFMIHNNIAAPPPYRDEDNNRMVIRHSPCGDAHCFEPTHLVYGTHIENCYDDKIANGTLRRGAANSRTLITEELARRIKASKPIVRQGQKGHLTKKKRAEQFGVSESLVAAIDRGTTWAHLFDDSRAASAERRAKARARQLRAKARIWTKAMYETALERLNAKVLITPDVSQHVSTPCHVWTGGKNVHGYGMISVHGKPMLSHVLACEIKLERPLRVGEELVRHLCDIRSCCA